MAIEINGDKSLRRCVYKDPDGNSHEVEKIKVRYGNTSSAVYAGLKVYVSYSLWKERGKFFDFFGQYFYSSKTSNMYVSIPKNAISNVYTFNRLYLNLHVYSKSGDGTVFYDIYHTQTYLLPDGIEISGSGTGQRRFIGDVVGYISVTTYIDLEYSIKYDDGIIEKGEYHNNIYEEYGVNASDVHRFGGTFNVLEPRNLIEKLVWQKDPLRVYRQQIESIIIYDVGVVSEYIGTYCGDDEYKYYCDNNPGIVVRIKDVAYTKASKIKSITLTGYAHILVNNTYLYKAKTETKTLTGNEVGSAISVYPDFDYLADYEYSTALPRVEYSIKLEVTYEDGYVYTYNKSNLIYMSIKDTNNSFKQYNIETTAFPALKN